MLYTAIGERIGALVALVSRMPPNPVPTHFMPRRGSFKLLP